MNEELSSTLRVLAPPDRFRLRERAPPRRGGDKVGRLRLPGTHPIESGGFHRLPAAPPVTLTL
eukprot:5176709-Pleurochrysis_carterae.AAC.2